MIDFGDGNGDDVCFAIKMDSLEEYERVTKHLEGYGLTVFGPLQLKLKPDEFRWVNQQLNVFGDGDAILITFDPAEWEGAPTLTASAILQYKIHFKPHDISLEQIK